MIAARLLPIAVAVVLSLHARLTLALPVKNEELSLRSVSVANDDASTLALREPSEEDELLDLVQRTPQIKAPLGLIRRPPGLVNPLIRPRPGPVSPLIRPRPGLVNPGLIRRPGPVNPGLIRRPGLVNLGLIRRPTGLAPPKGRRSLDEDELLDLVERMPQSNPRPRPPRPVGPRPMPRPGPRPLPPRPLPPVPRPVRPLPNPPSRPVGPRPRPIGPRPRSFDEGNELAGRTIEDEIIEELLHRGYYDDMDLD